MLFAAFVLSALTLGAPAVEDSSLQGIHHRIYRIHYTFELKENRQGYSLTEEAEVCCRFRKEPDFGDRLMPIGEDQYSRVDRVEAFFNGKRIRDRDIVEQYPPIEDEFFPSGRMVNIYMGGKVEAGDSVVYSYRRTFDDAAYMRLLPVWNYSRVESYELEFYHPRDVQVSFELYSPRGTVAYESNRVNSDRTTFKLAPLDHVDPLPYFLRNDYHTMILVSFSKSGELLTPTATSRFVEWYGEQTSLKPVLTGGVDGILMDSLRNAGTAESKLGIINQWVQQNIRYIADSRYPHAIIPHTPDTVLQRMYGDCKDRASLVSALARSQGIDVWMALVSTEATPDFEGVHVSQFNHVISAWEHGDEVVFFDPTARHTALGVVPNYLIGQSALILNPDRPRRLRIPASALDNPSVDISLSGHVDSLQAVSARIQLRHDFLRLTKVASMEMSAVEYERYLVKGLSDLIPGIRLSEFTAVQGDEFEMFVTARADLSRFVVSSPKQMYVPKGVFAPYEYEVFSRATDSLPIGFRYPTTRRLQLDLRGAEADSTGQRKEIGDAAVFWFSTSIDTAADGTLHFEWESKRLDREFNGASKSTLLEYFREFEKMKTDVYVIRKGSGI